MEYFSIYPFTQDMEDFRTARILEMINNSTKSLAIGGNVTWKHFMPSYLPNQGETKAENNKRAKDLENAERMLVGAILASGIGKMDT